MPCQKLTMGTPLSPAVPGICVAVGMMLGWLMAMHMMRSWVLMSGTVSHVVSGPLNAEYVGRHSVMSGKHG